MQDRSPRRLEPAAGHTAKSHQTGSTIDTRDDTSSSLADNGVAFPIVEALPAINKRRALRDTSPAEALPLARRAAAVLVSLFAASQLRPHQSALFAVRSDVLVDPLMADLRFVAPDDLFGAQFFSQGRAHDRPDRIIEARLRTCRVSALHTLALCLVTFAGRILRVALELATDRARRAFNLLPDPAAREATTVKVLNLVAFVMAQVRAAYGQFHLPVKLCSLPRLSQFTSSGGALQD